MRITLFKPILRKKFLKDKFRSWYIGFSSLRSFLNAKDPGHEVRIAKVRPDVLKQRPDLIGISSVSELWPITVACIRKFRKAGFQGPIIVGGPHVTALPQTLPDEATCAVVGQGEVPFLQLVRAYAKAKDPDLSQIPGLAYWGSGHELKRTPPPVPIPLDEIPVDVHEHSRVWMQLATIRGCPYQCEHCVEHNNQGKPRWLSAEKLLWIMEQRLKATGNPHFFFQDDTFLAAPKRLARLHKLMAKKNLFGRFNIHLISMNANLVREGTIRQLKDIGSVKIGFGCESFNPRVLGAIKRGVVKLSHLEFAMRQAKRVGLSPVGGSLVFGYLGETRAEMLDCIRRVKHYEKAKSFKHWGCYVCQPLPGSLLWCRGLKEGWLSEDMDFSTLRIDADGEHFSSPWFYMNAANVPRGEFRAILHKERFAGKNRFKRERNRFLSWSLARPVPGLAMSMTAATTTPRSRCAS